jgi:hypothetical protein
MRTKRCIQGKGVAAFAVALSLWIGVVLRDWSPCGCDPNPAGEPLKATLLGEAGLPALIAVLGMCVLMRSRPRKK